MAHVSRINSSFETQSDEMHGRTPRLIPAAAAAAAQTN